MTLHYRSNRPLNFSPPTGAKAIVFLHGNSCSSAAWEAILQNSHLQDYWLLAPDFPGHGKSQASGNKLETYSLNGLAKAIESWMHSMNLHDVYLVGHSLGGHVAIHLGRSIHPIGVFIVGAPPLRSLDSIAGAFNLTGDGAGFLFQGELNKEQATKLAGLFAPNTFSERLSQDILNTDVEFRNTFASSLSPDTMIDEVSVLDALKCPVAIVHATKDALVNQAYVTSIKSVNLWKGQTQLIESGHSPHLEAPAKLAAMIREFVER